MPIPNNQIRIAEIVMQGIRSSQGANSKNFSFVFHYRRTSVSNTPDETVLLTQFNTNFAVNAVNYLNNTYTNNLLTCRFLDDAQRAVVPMSVNNVGAIAGDSMPSHASVFILLRTALRGRSYRGGKHFGPLSESDTTAGSADILNAGAIVNFTAMKALCTGSLIDANGNTWVPCILSRKPPSQLKTNPTTVVTNDVVAGFLNKRIGRMKRRTVQSVY